MWAASISNRLSPRAIIFVMAYISNFSVISKNALTFHSWYYLGNCPSNLDLADIISIPVFNSSWVFGKNLTAESSTHPSAALVIIKTSPLFLANKSNLLA